MAKRATASEPLPDAIAARVDAWIESTRGRHAPPLTFAEVRKGVQALSSLYVERRGGRDLARRSLAGAGKRAAFATYYAPLHFLAAYYAVAARPRPCAGEALTLYDLGCGTGAAGAGAAVALGARARVVASDRSGFAIGEARAAYAAFGLRAVARRRDLLAALPRLRGTSLVCLGWCVNELDAAARDELLAWLQGAGRRAGLCLLEPLASSASPWWDDWVDALAESGARAERPRARIERPEWIAELDRAAGLDHREIGARLLWRDPR